jgi:pimeloyl-ACP methyl ester carboxylesterase
MQGKARTPQLVQRALDVLTQSRYFAGVGERLLIGNLKQVRLYMSDATTRSRIQARIVACVGADARIMIGHSLGSIVAYEALAAHPEWGITTLVTLGSPLGIRNLIFDRLSPKPSDGVGAWPGSIARWFNIADGGDVVALNKKLSSLFGGKVVDREIHNEATAHDVSPYLTAKETGEAIQSGLEA